MALAVLVAGVQALAPTHASAFQAECTDDWTECGYVDQGDPDGNGSNTSSTPGDGYSTSGDDGDWEDSASTEDPAGLADDSDASEDDKGSKQEDRTIAEKAKGDLGEKQGSVPPPKGSPFGGELPKRSLGTSSADADDALPVCTAEGSRVPCRARNSFHYNPDEPFKQMFGPGRGWSPGRFELQMEECRRLQEQAWDLAAVAYIADYFGVTVDLLEFKQEDVRYRWDFEWCDFIYMEAPLPGSDTRPGSSPGGRHSKKRGVALG